MIPISNSYCKASTVKLVFHCIVRPDSSLTLLVVNNIFLLSEDEINWEYFRVYSTASQKSDNRSRKYPKMFKTRMPGVIMLLFNKIFCCVIGDIFILKWGQNMKKKMLSTSMKNSIVVQQCFLVVYPHFLAIYPYGKQWDYLGKKLQNATNGIVFHGLIGEIMQP